MLVSFCVLICFLATKVIAFMDFTTSAKYGIIGEPFHFYCVSSDYMYGPVIYRNDNDTGSCDRYKNERYSRECSYLYFDLVNLTLTIPGENMTEDENQSVWFCKHRYEPSMSSNFTLTVAVPIQSVTISPKSDSSQKPSIVHGYNTTVHCQVVDVRPPAKFQWYIDSGRVYNSKLITVSVSGSDMTRYNVTSTLNLRFDKYKSLRTVKCSANNIENKNAAKSGETNIEIMYPPVNSPTIEGYITGQRLFINDPPLLLTCKVGTGWPKPSLDFVCLEQKQITDDTQDYLVRKITLDVSEKLNGQSCACIATHPVWDYSEKAHIIFTVLDPTNLGASDDTPEIIYARISIVTLGAVVLVLVAATMGQICLRKRRCCLTNQNDKDTYERHGMNLTTQNYEVLRRQQPSASPPARSSYEFAPRVTEESEDHIYSAAT